MVKEIPLHSTMYPGLVALVDDEDFDDLSQYRWRAIATPYTWYAERSGRLGEKKTVRMHRHILGLGPGELGDHWDGDGLNNRRSNLRACTKSQNQANTIRRPRGLSGYKGVYWQPRGQNWRAEIKCHRKFYFLGKFASKEDAAKAYDRKAIELFGEFAVINFPNEIAA